MRHLGRRRPVLVRYLRLVPGCMPFLEALKQAVYCCPSGNAYIATQHDVA